MEHRLEFKPYRLPMRQPLRTAHGLWREREGFLIRLESPEGTYRWGDIAPMPWFGTETISEAGDWLRSSRGAITGESMANIDPRLSCVRFALHCALSPGAAGTERRPVSALLPAGRDALALLPDRLENGYLAFKWKVGVGDAADERVVLDDLIAMLPAYTRLRLDANGAWDRRTASRWLTRCADRPVEFVEQPLAPEDHDGLLGLASDFPVPLALDESVASLDAARRWQADGWKGIFVIKPAIAGPLDEIESWIASSRADVVISSAIESAIGRAAVLRFACRENITKRALGFGLGAIFADGQWDGPVIPPIIDGAWGNSIDEEALWNALP
ncbi:MAG TPA: o-succinylbenzoate synthase [Candidatus Didemnitutus sp.]|nr:o-succinylbenzoate synthase [Candidatus Didemnitutus sp.]